MLDDRPPLGELGRLQLGERLRRLPIGRRRLEGLGVELLPLRYDHQGLAAEMRREKLPEEFVETVLTGWWTTCLEILPARERAASRF